MPRNSRRAIVQTPPVVSSDQETLENIPQERRSALFVPTEPSFANYSLEAEEIRLGTFSRPTYAVSVDEPLRVTRPEIFTATCGICGDYRITCRRHNGQTYCQRCYNEHVAECVFCQIVIDTRRRSAGVRFFQQPRTTPYNPAQAACCSRCIDGRLSPCRRCHTHYSNELLVDGVCSLCASALETLVNRRMPYSTNVLDYFPVYDAPTDRLLLGVELEVQTTRDITGQIRLIRESMKNFVICKSDSSIGDEGFEIVTAPASIDGHKRMWEGFFKCGHETTSWKSGKCGMHVHINRAALTPLKIGKMLVFVNAACNAEFISAVAGRYSSHYTQITEKNVTDGNNRVPADARYESIRRRVYNAASERMNRITHDDRYQALNVSGEKTVELRIFRGNVKREGFFKNLEFAHALVKFVEDASSSELTYTAFCKWLCERRSQYPFLTKFLEGSKSKITKTAFMAENAHNDNKCVTRFSHSKRLGKTVEEVMKMVKEKASFTFAETV